MKFRGQKWLSGSYLSIAGSPSSPKKLRTALIAIDSKGRSPNEPEWAEMLPDFRRTYERIVGLCYLPQGDPSRTKARLDAVLRAAYYCDAVVVASRALAETPDCRPVSLHLETVAHCDINDRRIFV